MPDTRARRLLLVLPNWLGDLVMTLPALDRLAAAAHAAGMGVDVSVRRRWAPLLQADPRIDGCILYERTGRHAGWLGVGRLASCWRAAPAAAAVITPPSLRMAAAAALARIPIRVGQSTDGRRFLLTHAVAPGRPRGRRHYGDEMSDLARAALAACDLRDQEPDTAAVPSLPGLAARPAADLGAGPPVWVLAPGTTYGPAKTWPVLHMAAFVTEAVRARGVRVLLLGDASTRSLACAIRDAASVSWRDETAGPAAAIDRVGRTDLLAVVDILRSAEVFVGNDSGLMHVAAALGVPTVGIFGSSSPAWTAPRGANARALTAVGFPCQPCFRKTCNQPRFCLDTVTAGTVLAAVNDAVDTERKDAP